MSVSKVSDEDWLAQVNGEYGGQDLAAGGAPADEHDSEPHDLDDSDQQCASAPDNNDSEALFLDVPDGTRDHPASTRFDHKVLAGFGGIAAVAVIVALGAGVMFYSGGDKEASRPRDGVADPAAVAVAKPVQTPAPAADADRSLPYTADASGSCGLGSTPAQSMSGTDPRNAFVCVRGGADGQVINLDLSNSYVISAIKLTSGWVGKDASGVSQWSQYRVVTTVQYSFDDVDGTFITQETGNVHGEAVVKVKRRGGERGVVASKITMLIRQTSRPPAQPEPSPAPAGSGQPATAGVLPGILGPGGTDGPPLPSANPFAQTGQTTPNSDPVDAKFAISRLEVIGHEPI